MDPGILLTLTTGILIAFSSLVSSAASFGCHISGIHGYRLDQARHEPIAVAAYAALFGDGGEINER
jgi:hypothetical protein